ncbi:hypothetical protein [Streptomyces sp. H27-C3]|uniref:hypothetical protein n=1 Tax=Streptomyces sp. H27-C3 TaxID=3046305 RepID=UPI0024B93950|nr:hypothetical protein [Streptomyces sp. H27-C3]MDJ0466980.1 hypothetical protein [Streptomyces sp. H27-C3]
MPKRSWRRLGSAQPESLVICERLESAPLLLDGIWEGELEDVLLKDLAFAWGSRFRPGR